MKEKEPRLILDNGVELVPLTDPETGAVEEPYVWVLPGHSKHRPRIITHERALKEFANLSPKVEIKTIYYR